MLTAHNSHALTQTQFASIGFFLLLVWLKGMSKTNSSRHQKKKTTSLKMIESV